MPSLSVKRNQPTDLLVGSSIFCHSPVTKGSATAVEFAAATNIKCAAIARFTDCTANALLHRRKNQVPRIDDPEMVARQCGDFWTAVYPTPVRSAEINPCKFRLLAGNRGLRVAANPNAGSAVVQPCEFIVTDAIAPAAALRRLLLCRRRHRCGGHRARCRQRRRYSGAALGALACGGAGFVVSLDGAQRID